MHERRTQMPQPERQTETPQPNIPPQQSAEQQQKTPQPERQAEMPQPERQPETRQPTKHQPNTLQPPEHQTDRFRECRLCPRECGVNRHVKTGFCGGGDRLRLARASLHCGEEPCISGTRGSGTVFFSGCSLRCVYCQNRKISTENFGTEITAQRLAGIFSELQEKGAHNINLVTPTHFMPLITDAIELSRGKIKIPFVYNTSGYEKADVIRQLKGYIDIYLTDIKYYSRELSEKYSAAPDYFERAAEAAAEMISQTGKPRKDSNGILQSGVIIRHLVIPSLRRDSVRILGELAARFERDDFILSLMRQYTPNGNLEDYPEIDRRLTSFEYKTAVNEAIRLGFEGGYMQAAESADQSYTPSFDLSGI